MLLRSPRNLQYPITVTELLKQPGDNVDRFAPLFSYFSTTVVAENDDDGKEQQVEKRLHTRFESETDGKFLRWRIAEGAVIKEAGVELIEIEEPCRHDVQFGGMCANCGKDMTEVNYNTSIPDIQRANINMAHSNTALRVSSAEAARSEEDAKRRLLKSRKLSLVVDLDQTVIQACVDPTVGIWQKDSNNPNYEALKDVSAFQLLEEGPGKGTWYYVKQRPGLSNFLEKIAMLYELHIYTMATRAYATQIAKVVDPEGMLFGDRILSRDESGSQHLKSLHRLFPMDTKMVLIIDDRGDVWNWSANLVKVSPYSFFPVGDINASFLPKRTDLAAPEPKAHPPTPLMTSIALDKETSSKDAVFSAENGKPSPFTNGTSPEEAYSTSANVSASTPENTIRSDDESNLQQKEAQQEEVLAAQVHDRPLLQKQQALDKLVDDANEQDVEKQLNNDQNVANHIKNHHQHLPILQNDDNELEHLEKVLRAVHKAFFHAYDSSLAGAQGGRVAALRGEKPTKVRPHEDLAIVPDVKVLMPAMKQTVLDGVELIFSGVLPLGMNVLYSDVGRWAMSFGALISLEVTPSTTHVIASKNRRTMKVRMAARNPRIYIVTMGWLLDSLVQWKRLDEKAYIIKVEPDKDHANAAQDLSVINTPDGRLSSSEDDEYPTDEGVATTLATDKRNLTVNTDIQDIGTDDAPLSPIDKMMQETTAEDYAAMLRDIADLDDDDEGGDTDDGTDDDSDSSDVSQQSQESTRKRKLDTMGDTTDGEMESDASVNGLGSKLQKRKRRALARITSLTHVATARKSPAPSSTGDAASKGAEPGDDEAVEDQHGNVDEDDDDDDDDALFEADFTAQLLEGQEEQDDDGG